MAARDLDSVAGNGASDRVVELSIPSRIEMLAVLDGLVQAIATQMEFEEEAVFAIANSIIEAGTNAIQHGHEHDPSKVVHFRFVLGDEALEVFVRDHGPGFDLDRVLRCDPTRPEDLMKSRGRGIFIMRSMMDAVTFDIRPGEGTRVHLLKRLVRSDAGSVPGD